MSAPVVMDVDAEEEVAEQRRLTVQRTSELLLSGWKMLAWTCPLCHSVLMESKDGDMHCPGCDLPVRLERDLSEGMDKADMDALLAEENNVVVPSPSNRLRSVDYQDLASGRAVVVDENEDEDPLLDDFPQSYEQMRKEYDEKNARQAQATKKMGEKLLQGWTMLADGCPDSDCRGTPLMREKEASSMLCVCCERLYVKQNDEIVPASTPSTSHKRPAPTSNNSSGLPSSQWKKSKDEDDRFWGEMDVNILRKARPAASDTSEKISQKLLQGWALLEGCCPLPNCSGNVPLMRDKAGKHYCVECGYVTENAETAYSSPPPSKSNQLIPPPPAAATFSVNSSFDAKSVLKQSLEKKLLAVSAQLEQESNIKACTELTDLVLKLCAALKAANEI